MKSRLGRGTRFSIDMPRGGNVAPRTVPLSGHALIDRLDRSYLMHRPMPGAPLVTASANSTEGLAMGLARDLAPIRVNAVCLGLIVSEQVEKMGEPMIKAYTANLPLPRGGTVEEAAEAYLYVMRATYVTGQIVRVDGGGSLV